MSKAADAPRPVRFDGLGLNDRMRQRFEMVFKGIEQPVAAFVNSTVAEASIVDLDNSGAREDWPRYRERYPDRPAILLSLAPVPDSDEVCLLKPIEISALLRAVADIRRRLDANLQPPSGATLESAVVPADAASAPPTVILDEPGTTPAEDPAWFRETVVLPEAPRGALTAAAPAPDDPTSARDPERSLPIESAQDPHDRLLGQVLRWRNSLADLGLPSMLHWGRLWLMYEPDSECVLGNFSRDQLRDAAELPCPDDHVRIDHAAPDLIAEIEGDPSRVGARWTHPDGLIWDLALWSFADCLPPGTDAEERLYLSHWPNLTRLTLTPNALRISALWSEQPLSIAAIAEALRVPATEVGAFYAACHYTGIAGPAKRNVDRIFRTGPIAAAPDRPLFGRLLGRLRGLLQADGQAGPGSPSR